MKVTKTSQTVILVLAGALFAATGHAQAADAA